MNFKKKITKEQIEALTILIKNENDDARAVRRAQAIILLEDKASAATIKTMTGYEREVAVKTRRNFLKNGIDILRTKKKEKKSKKLLTRSQKEAVVITLNTQKPSNYGYKNQDIWTTKILSDLIMEQWGVRYKSKTSLYLLFKEAKFTFRKPEKQSERRNEKVIAEWKKTYKLIIEEECSRADSIILVGDEAALSSQTRLQRAWLPLNGPAIIQDTVKRKMIHLYGFLNVLSGEAYAYKAPDQTGQTTISILKKLAKLFFGKRIVIFWDNASWHKSKEVRDFLNSTKQFKLYNFPPYAPDLNPQEHIWKEVRENIVNNRLINDINVAADNAIAFIKNSVFKYKFFGVHGTFSM